MSKVEEKRIKTDKERVKESQQCFSKFAQAVLKNNFEEAYVYLVKNLENQVNYDYHYNLRLYFMLLKEILKDQKDFSMMDTLLSFEDQPHNNNYYDHFIDFNKAVMNHDFDSAYQAITLFRDAEEKRKGMNSISTRLFYKLTSYIDSMNNKKEQERLLKDQEKGVNFKEYFVRMRKSIELENYEEALVNIEEICQYTDLPDDQYKFRKMASIIEKYLEIRESKEPLPTVNIDYTTCKDNNILIFNRALIEQDYETAYQKIGKCIEQNPKSSILKIHKRLLYKIIKQDKENKHIDKKVDIETLTQLIKDKKYQQVAELIESESDERLSRCLFKMVEDIKALNDKTYVDAEPPVYQTEEYKIFKRFFEALKYRDYQEASCLVEKCLKVSKTYQNDVSELMIYQYVLEDIIKLREKLEEEERQEVKQRELKERQESILNKETLTEKDFVKLENITNQLLDTNEIAHALRIKQMLNTIQVIDEFDLDDNSFAKFEYSEKDILEKFLKAIDLGDYQTAYKMAKEEKWCHENQSSKNQAEHLMYKKLLYIINDKLDSSSYKETDERQPEEDIDIPAIEHLKKLKTFLKEEKFVAAQRYYQENDLDEISDTLDMELEVFLQFLSQPIKKEKRQLEQKMKEVQRNGDCEQAKKDLEVYREFIKEHNFNKNIDYYELRLASLEKEQNTPDYEEKNNMYDQALAYCKEKRYEEAIEILNDYIAKDNNLSAKGYLLRGSCLEYTKNYSEAKEDYQMAISIIPEPQAFHRLGKLSLYQGNYQDAIDYFLEYEARRPSYHAMNLEALSESYQALGQEELSTRYKSLAKTIKNG